MRGRSAAFAASAPSDSRKKFRTPSMTWSSPTLPLMLSPSREYPAAGRPRPSCTDVCMSSQCGRMMRSTRSSAREGSAWRRFTFSSTIVMPPALVS